MSFIYEIAKQKMMDSTLGNLTSATVKIGLVTTANLVTDTALPTRVGTDQTLTGVTVASGVFDANNPTFTAVAAGSTVIGVVIYTGTTPIAYVNSGAGLPFATNGGDVTLNFSDSATKIFKL